MLQVLLPTQTSRIGVTARLGQHRCHQKTIRDHRRTRSQKLGREHHGSFCWVCKKIKRNCPKRAEAPGRSNTSNVEASPGVSTDDLTDEQLEQVLADRRLRPEQALLSGSATNTVCTESTGVPAVGPTLLLDVSIEGLPVKAMVDTGAQSTIISRSTLHAIGLHLSQSGRPVPTLELPTMRLYGKDGPGDGRQLTITAQLQLTFTVDGESVTVLVFVQPDSEQPCLLGMNAIPSLGITVLRCNGEPILPDATSEPKSEQHGLVWWSLLLFRARRDAI